MENRRHARYALWFPVNVATEDKQTLAVAKDASQSGIAISAPAGVAAGAHVTLTFRIPPDGGEERTVSGRVVRHETNQEDPHGLWPYRIGIAFESPVPELEELLSRTGTKLEER
jgi:hypothetical protein